MCRGGSEEFEYVHVKVAANLSHNGTANWVDKPVDRCIAPIVRALQEGGLDMLGSCCGHGVARGEIILADGRGLIVLTPQQYGDYVLEGARG